MDNIPLHQPAAPTQEAEIIEVGHLENPSTVDLRRDNIREKIALHQTYLVIVATVMPIVAAVIFPDRAASIKEISTSIIPIIIGIYGTIIGFYFGQGN
jgi:hypothetical protein